MNHRFSTVKLPDLGLTRDEVHIWSADLDIPASGFSDWLSPDEIQRAERYYSNKDRDRFIVCRGLLRKILSDYLDIEPSQIQFSYGKNNKPVLANNFNRDELHFSLSHSEGLAIYALTLASLIGVDVEYMRNIPEMEKIAKRFFSPREYDIFQILPETEKRQAFFNCWTRKEAFIKATGDGLSYPLDKFEVSLAPGESARLINIEGDREAAARWSICDLNIKEGYKAALVRKGQIFKTVFFNIYPWVNNHEKSGSLLIR